MQTHLTNNPEYQLKKALDCLPDLRQADPKIVFVTGASGAGKTYLIDATENSFSHPKLLYARFDQVGIPPRETMIEKCGSEREWQRMTTHEWVRRFVEEHTDKHLFVFEGSFDLNCASEACEKFGISSYRMIVATVSDTVMKERLEGRGQPELANSDMIGWSRFLRQQGEQNGALILDTSQMDTSAAVGEVIKEASRLMMGRSISYGH